MKNIVSVYKTCARTGDFLSEKKPMKFRDGGSLPEAEVINIYDDAKYQRIFGFGGAFTEAAAYNYSMMSEQTKQELIDAYFDSEKGIGYTLGRTHIGSCDFSLSLYSNVSDSDKELSSFNLDRDMEYVIPFVRDAIKKTGDKLVLFASPWSPPGFMKTTGREILGGELLEEYKDSWALYFVKYIQEMKKAGVDIWGVTVQNEPNAVQTWESCYYTAEAEAEFVKNHLIPVFDKNGLGDIKIIVWDHNKEQLYDRAKVIFADKELRKRIWGIGMHWYSGEHFDAVRVTKEKYKEKDILLTEMCVGMPKSRRGYVAAAEKYAHDMMGNLLAGACGICDWNMLLDTDGAPNHNRIGDCAAPIYYDKAQDEIRLTDIYYYIGHFSKFIKKGARRLAVSKYSDDLEVCAFENTNSAIAAVILNRSGRRKFFNLKYNGKYVRGQSSPNSIMTLVFDKIK